MPRICAFRTEKHLGSGLIGSFRKLKAAGENIPVFWRTAGMKVPLWPTQFFLQIVGIDSQNFYLNFAIYNFHTDISVASTFPAMLSQLLQQSEYLVGLD